MPDTDKWMNTKEYFVTYTILVNAASGDDEEDNKSDKGLMPTKIVVGTE